MEQKRRQKIDYENIYILLKDMKCDEEKDFIGRGGFGKVYKAEHIVLGEVALKKIRDDGKNVNVTPMYNALKKEIAMLSHLRHANIILLHGMVWESSYHAIVMEYMAHGDLETFLHREENLYQKDCEYEKRQVKIHNVVKTRLLCDVAQGIHYLHTQQKQIIHNDLKINNVLVSSSLIAKIGDFGLAQWRTVSSDLALDSKGATYTHICPERWANLNLKSTKCDIYSFGILMWEVYSEEKPFERNANKPDLLKIMVRDGSRPELSKLPTDLSSRLTTLLESCWHQIARQRPAIDAVCRELKEFLTEVDSDAELRKQMAALITKNSEPSRDSIQYQVTSSSTSSSSRRQRQEQISRETNDHETVNAQQAAAVSVDYLLTENAVNEQLPTNQKQLQNVSKKSKDASFVLPYTQVK